jgi:hypothetical protein
MKILYAAALAALIPCAGMAKGVKAGLYEIAGIQEICLQSAGTWYSPTFSNWGGDWLVSGKDTHIFGNYNSGAGNDSIVIKGKAVSWTEWSDDLTYVNEDDPTTFTYIGTCTEAASRPGKFANPAQR